MSSSKIIAKFTALLLAAILIIAGNAFAGVIKGRVTDKATGEPIPGVSIIVVGTKIGAQTDPDGQFAIKGIPAGVYTLKATATGYSPFESAKLNVTENGTSKVNIQLQKTVAELGKIIKVEADRKAIDKYSASGNAMQTIMNSPSPDVAQMPLEPLTRQIVPLSKKIAPPNWPNQYNWHSPSTGGSLPVNGQPYDAMFFKDYGTNPFVDTEDDPLSTFGADVDDASFVMARTYLQGGNLPPDDAIRTEEFINHFNYDYAPPEFGPFSVDAEGAPSPFGRNSILLKIGIKGKEIFEESRKPANLVFVIDVSGSMADGNRLEMVKRALRILVDNLENDDNIGIVAYTTTAWDVLEPVSVAHRRQILTAIESLHPMNSTNAEAGLRLGYQMVERHLEPRKINRVILCSDGVANEGNTSADDILNWIKRYTDRGIFLSTIGFGMGNYNDILMEQLADKGNGSYFYVSNMDDARKVFLENLTGTLQVIAKDVKIQLDFDPAAVRSYRLLGYENRDVADEKFRDDIEDGGEIGSGHQVTAIYEIKLAKGRVPSHVANLNIRFKKPNSDRGEEFNYVISNQYIHRRFDDASDNFKLAVAAAQFAEILGKSYWAKDAQLSAVQQIAEEVSINFDSQEVSDFLEMIDQAEKLEGQIAGEHLD